MKKISLISFVLLIITTYAQATPTPVPHLQLYIENSLYNTGTQTWSKMSSSDPYSFVLWVMGYSGSIADVKLTAAYNTNLTGSITITPTTGTNFNSWSNFTDTAAPDAPTLLIDGSGTDGTIPLDGNGNSLEAHGVFGSGVSWKEWYLGNFTPGETFLADFNAGVPSTLNKPGQLNAYTVTVTGYDWVHFDAFDHYVKSNEDAQYIKAPYSHDAQGNTEVVPEPSTLILVGIGMAGLAFYRKRKN